MGAAAPIVGMATQVIGGERGRKGARRGLSQAAGEYSAPPSLQAGSSAYDIFGTKNASVFENLKNLLSGNSLNELLPALRSNSINTQNQQRSFASALGKSGLTGSGFGLGNNFAIQNQGAVNASNILSQLPALQRANIGAALPFFQTMMGDIARRQAGRAGIKERSAGTNAAAKTESANTEGNLIGSMGGGGKGGGKGGSV